VSHQRPIFNGNLLGKANRIVMNGLVDTADYVGRNRSAVDWAASQLQPDLFDMSSFMATLLGALPLTGNSARWAYKFKRSSREGVSNIVQVAQAEDDFTNSFMALNLYEFNNTSAGDQDGPFSAPLRVIGPVGSSWTGLNFTTADFNQPVIMHKTYRTDGEVAYVFSHPNPVRCIEEPILP